MSDDGLDNTGGLVCLLRELISHAGENPDLSPLLGEGGAPFHGRGHLIQFVFIRKDAVLRLPAFWYPTAVGDIVLNGEVKCRLVGAGLPA